MLAQTLDAPGLAIVAVGLLLAAVAARELWVWRGDLRGWLTMVAALGGAVLLAFILPQLFE